MNTPTDGEEKESQWVDTIQCAPNCSINDFSEYCEEYTCANCRNGYRDELDDGNEYPE
jgi:hypothetical protein